MAVWLVRAVEAGRAKTMLLKEAVTIVLPRTKMVSSISGEGCFAIEWCEEEGSGEGCDWWVVDRVGRRRRLSLVHGPDDGAV